MIVPADNVEVATRAAIARTDLRSAADHAQTCRRATNTPILSRTRRWHRGKIRRRTGDSRAARVGRDDGASAPTRRRAGDIEQRLTYNIAYEPLRNLMLDVSRNVGGRANADQFSGAVVPVMLLPDEGDDERARVRVDLTSDRIGTLETVGRPRRCHYRRLKTTNLRRSCCRFALPLSNGKSLPLRSRCALTWRSHWNFVAQTPVGRVSAISIARRDRTRNRLDASRRRVPQIAAGAQAAASRRQWIDHARTCVGPVVAYQNWSSRSRGVSRSLSAVDKVRIKLPSDVRESGLIAAVEWSFRTLRARRPGITPLNLPNVAPPTMRMSSNSGTSSLPDAPRRRMVCNLSRRRCLAAAKRGDAIGNLCCQQAEHLLASSGDVSARHGLDWRGAHIRPKIATFAACSGRMGRRVDPSRLA